MLTKKIDDSRKQVEFNSLEDLVPSDHLLRKVDKAINFDFIYDEVKHLYSEVSRPSVDPVVLIKIVLIQYLFGIPSMRQTIAEIQVNIAYRWFMGYSISEPIPHFSTFSKNYSRRFKDSNIFSTIFAKILEIAAAEGLLAPEQIYIDSTHIKASANKKKYVKVEVEVEAKKYKEQLDKEIEEDREQHGKKPPKGGSGNSKSIETKVIPQSTTDSDSGMFYKSEKEKCFAYLAHTACDDHNFILGFSVTPGNVHDSTVFDDVYLDVYERYGNEMTAVAVDAGYKTPYIAKTVLDSGVLPSFPYKRPMTKEGYFRKYEYIYDEHNDIYICPEGLELKYSTTNKDGYKQYKSNLQCCSGCPSRQRCTSSKNMQKVVSRHVWDDYLEEAEHLRHNSYVASVYKRRKETIERVFADAKEKHGMRYTHLRGLTQINMAVTLTFACMNLKKLATKLWKKRRKSSFIHTRFWLFRRVSFCF